MDGDASAVGEWKREARRVFRFSDFVMRVAWLYGEHAWSVFVAVDVRCCE